jgi:HPt (histidine-containing phosphotransfer) domain-containing protein
LDKITIECDAELEGLIPNYLKNRSNDIKTIRECLTSGDFEKILTLGHSMKGSGGGYGFDKITEIGGRIETAAEAKDVAEIDSAVQTLEDYVQRVDVVFV